MTNNYKPNDLKIAAIHQPSFFPWLGFFNKISRSDVFVILDSVQFPKTGGYWANRVKIIISNTDNWITVPIVRTYSGTKLINEIQIDNSKKWNVKMLKTIEVNYKKAPFFEQIFPVIYNLLIEPKNNLCENNIFIINKLSEILNIRNSHFVLSSGLNVQSKATDMLIEITKKVNCNAYMCGAGASKYQEDEKFELNGIKLIYQNFVHPNYVQFNTEKFIQGLSIIDVLMNCGTEKTAQLINQIN
jgi:hypothetical protein